jgi:DNA-binding NarL/FixJ family response regulator
VVGETDEAIRLYGELTAEDGPGAPLRGRLHSLGSSGAAGDVAEQDGAPVHVAILASDAIVGAGAVAYLRSRPGIVPVATARTAHVVLVLADRLDDLASWMEGLSSQQETMRFVLVSDWIAVPQLVRAVGCGQVSVLPREGTSYEQVVRAIFQVRTGGGAGVRPVDAFGSRLASGGGRTDPIVPELESREVEVLRLVAEGLDTVEIARRLNYSERTIKNVIHVLLGRLELRNRPHAVAFAMRHGLL